MRTKHTPGPWVVVMLKRGESQPIPVVYRDTAEKSSAICETVRNYHSEDPVVSDEELLANANLLAAAPCLKAALEAICESGILKGPKNVELATLMIKALAKCDQ